MADHIPNRLNHLRFKSPIDVFPYDSPRGGTAPTLKPRFDRSGHVEYLRDQIAPISEEFESIQQERSSVDVSSDFGLILNVESEPGFPLAYESLEDQRSGISLLNLRHESSEEGDITKAAIFVPYGKLSVLEKKIDKYETEDNKNNDGEITGPKNANLLNNIHSIQVAAMEALWTDPDPMPKPDETVWFELWIRRDNQDDWKAQLTAECEQLGVEVPDQVLTFPDHIVVIAHASRNQLESSLDLLNCLSEVRKARPCSVGLTDLPGIEQEEWIDEALPRITWPHEDAPAVCLLDTGVNRSHPLLEPIISSSDMDTVFGDADHADEPNSAKAHGTPMAGLAAYGDLRNLMLSTATWEQLHRLESIKLIRHSSPHDPDNYGAITLQAIATPEAKFQRNRIYCMAVTTGGPNTYGNPSSWSTAMDCAAAATDNDEHPGRVILVSAGNTWQHDDTFTYPDTLLSNPIEDPAHAWNVITVGAVTEFTTIEEDDDEARRCDPVAPEHGLSPFTRTSHAWTEGRKDWPIKPDIVMEGGNLGLHRDYQDDYPSFDSLHPLSTNSHYRSQPPIRSFNATSAATAMASRVAAQIATRYPDIMPQTLRGLLVHSAQWPRTLLEREGIDPHKAGQTDAVKWLMRGYGYGVVNEQRAIESLDNQATFFTEDVILPYKGKAGNAKLNDCHLIKLPWPKALLEENIDVTCTLRVTLSYFIEPNPGTRSFESGKKYRYASHLLGFKPKRAGQTLEEFRSRLHADEESQGDTATDPGWAVGGTNRGKCGSLVQDVWQGSAADLADMDSIAVYPRAKGWWALRKYGEDREEHNCHERPVPYSLIISIETEADLPIYNTVSTAIDHLSVDTDIDLDA